MTALTYARKGTYRVNQNTLLLS